MRFTGAFLVASNCSSHLLCPPHRPFSRDCLNPALNTRSASVVLGWHLLPYWPQAAQGATYELPAAQHLTTMFTILVMLSSSCPLPKAEGMTQSILLCKAGLRVLHTGFLRAYLSNSSHTALEGL